MIEPPTSVGPWLRAVVVEIAPSTARGVVLRLDVPGRVPHLPGQHFVVRLTAADGYTAQRSYSVASAPSDPLLELFVERLDDGEVSPFLVDELRVGDHFDVRGPIGGWFVWRGDQAGIGIGGGSGVVPLVAMLRHAQFLGQPGLFRMVVSARTRDELPYAEEILSAGAVAAFTRQRPEGRLTASDLAVLGGEDGALPASTYFVCGSASFATAMSMLLVDRGVAARLIRVESFGASG